MPRPSNDLLTLGPYAIGINNRAAEHDVPVGDDGAAAVDLLNVDVSNTGRIHRRKGNTALRLLNQIHSAFGSDNHFLFVQAGVLRKGLPPSDTILRSGLSAAQMAYVEVNSEVYYSNGEVTGKVKADGTDAPWGVKTPTSQPVVAPDAAGGLPAGRYQVAVTFVRSDGEESASLSPIAVTVAEGGGVMLTAIPQPTEAGVNRVRIYFTDTNGDALRAYQTLVVGVTTLLVGAGTLGRVLETALDLPFPACTLLDYFNGRIYGASGNTVWFSKAFRFGILDTYITYSEPVSVLQATDGGVYVCADQTYWYGGAGPGAFTQSTLLPFGAVPGTGVKVRNSRNVAWFNKNGWVIGKPGGGIEQVTDKNVAVPEYASGAALFREERGIRQILGAFNTGTASTFVAGDAADAEVVRSET